MKYLKYFGAFLLFWSVNQAGTATPQRESGRTIRNTRTIVDMATNTPYQLQVHWHMAEDRTVFRLMDGTTVLDSLVSFGFQDKKHEQNLNSHFMYLAFRRRCGSGCTRNTAYVLAVRRQKLYKTLVLTNYAQSEETFMWGVEPEDRTALNERELYTVDLSLDTSRRYGLIVDESYEATGGTLRKEEHQQIRHYLSFDYERMIFTNSMTELKGEYLIPAMHPSGAPYTQHFQENKVAGATLHYQQYLYLGSNRWYGVYDIWQPVEDPPELLEE